tara:strand:- start:1556 stop:2218 length:663 start_codon:yes stop_codon:yes gene_type:complete
LKLSDKFDPDVNVTVSLIHRETGNLVDQRRSHNVVTNTGRAWLARLVGSDDYSQEPPHPHVTTKIKYMGFGCGGALQTDNSFSNSQSELVTVTSIEDPVTMAISGSVDTYLKKVDNQTTSSIYFPGDYRTRFVCDILESELSFATSKTRTSSKVVGTAVPVSEAGLYLSSAKPTFDASANPANPNEADPAQPNSLVAYNIFAPIVVTPNVMLRVEWELRF